MVLPVVTIILPPLLIRVPLVLDGVEPLVVYRNVTPGVLCIIYNPLERFQKNGAVVFLTSTTSDLILFCAVAITFSELPVIDEVGI